MPITALAPGVVVALGSAQVLTTPVSVVKELVDNALDASARAIFIDISTNTLDCIQVKDDGHGIAAEDRDHVARRHCTSKIQDLQDLSTLGGTWLGFRGEALASAAEMAGRLEIVTRTEGEVTATKLTIGKQGDVASRENTSHAVGTTVRVSNFLQQLPVRKEEAVKHAARTLQRIKELLQSYAMARPRVRFSLKILGAKNEKGNWSYAPRRNADMSDAALAVIGKDAAGQCSMYEMVEDMTTVTEGLGGEELPEGPFKIEAFLPTPTADVSKISNKGQFVSIDSRPVSCAHGTLKEVVSQYKRYIRAALGDKMTGTASLKDPFLCMNVVCPPASYDPNIEPAKDDVLFENPGRFLKIVEECFIGVYGEIQGQTGLKKDKLVPRSVGGNAFEKLLARKQPGNNTSREDEMVSSVHDVHSTSLDLETESNHAKHQSTEPASARQSSSEEEGEEDSENEDGLLTREGSRPTQQHAWRSTMYGDDDDDDESTEGTASASKPVRDRQTQPSLLQLGKAQTASTKPAAPTWNPANGSYMTPSPAVSSLNPPRRPLTPPFSTPHLPSSPFARPLPTSLRGTRGAEGVGQLAAADTHPHVLSLSRTTIQSSQIRSSEATSFPTSDVLENHFRSNGFISARCLPLSGPDEGRQTYSLVKSSNQYQTSGTKHRRERDVDISDMFTPGKTPRSTTTRRSSSPSKSGGRNRDIREILTTSSMSPERTVDQDRGIESSITPNLQSTSSATPAIHPDVEQALDYERRKQIASRNYRESLARMGNTPSSFSMPTKEKDSDGPDASQGLSLPGKSGTGKSPHQARYKAALTNLRQPPLPFPSLSTSISTSQTDRVIKATAMSETDPRRYLIRIRTSSSSTASNAKEKEMKRPRTSKLPFESVPSNLQLQSLSRNIQAPLEHIRRCMELAGRMDGYVSTGKMQETSVFREMARGMGAGVEVEVGLGTDENAVGMLEARTREVVRRFYATRARAGVGTGTEGDGLVEREGEEEEGEGVDMDMDLGRSLKDHERVLNVSLN
ncbi:MAG: hypothetical protein M1823_005217 [Watsoniomyces obsoletus]|nr:MAG: hypothetical protein M1823_005217 [Watsoniomyces obsoletus]